MAIVGRPNVGKSTLFNRIMKRRRAVVDKSPGVTRDRLYGEVEWSSRRFLLVDTGGLVPGTREAMELLVKQQVEIALKEADLILFLVDVRDGATPLDQEIGELLRRWGEKTILAASKVDNQSFEKEALEFHRLGFGDISPVSALHGLGIGDLLDRVVSRLSETPYELPREGVKIAILGRPNVGKSSLVNRILKAERLLVDELPGTTRDSIDTYVDYKGRKLTLIDTAGLRRKSKIKDSVEYYTTLRALRSLEECDVALVLMDSLANVSRQDKRIVSLAEERGRGLILVGTKIDLVDKRTKKSMPALLGRELGYLDWAPLVLTSAVTGEGIHETLDVALRVQEEMERKIGKKKLTEVVRQVAERHTPPGGVRIHSCAQTSTNPPRFVIRCNRPESIEESYLRYLKKSLRKAFGFVGVPIILRVER